MRNPYAEPYDPQRPVVCFDETSKQLVAEKRAPIPAKAGRRERFDYEYQRNGTRNLFMTCEPLAGWRHVGNDTVCGFDYLFPDMEIDLPNLQDDQVLRICGESEAEGLVYSGNEDDLFFDHVA